MDTLAHSLWTNLVFYKKYQHHKQQRWLAVFFSVLPDLVSFTPAFIYIFFTFKHFNPEFFNSHVWVFNYAAVSYNYTHSLVVFVLVMLIITAIRKGKIYPHTNKSENSVFNETKGLSFGTRIKRWIKGFGVGVYWPIGGWGFHILLDIPTHKEFYATPFLFPLSNVRNPYAVSWGHPLFMLANYSALVIIYIVWFWYRSRKKHEAAK